MSSTNALAAMGHRNRTTSRSGSPGVAEVVGWKNTLCLPGSVNCTVSSAMTVARCSWPPASSGGPLAARGASAMLAGFNWRWPPRVRGGLPGTPWSPCYLGYPREGQGMQVVVMGSAKQETRSPLGTVLGGGCRRGPRDHGPQISILTEVRRKAFLL